MTVPIQTMVRNYPNFEAEICKCCDSKKRCPNRPCVEEARETMEAISLGMKMGDALTAMLGGAK